MLLYLLKNYFHICISRKAFKAQSLFSSSPVISTNLLDSIYVEKKGCITTIVINRKHRKNAIDYDSARLLADKIREFEKDSTAKVGILYGAHGTFCSGADLQEIYKGRSNRLEDTGDGPMGPSRFELSKPIIAAISGYAVAGGLELALLCDMRVMEESAIFGVFFRRFGVPLIDGGTVRLPRLIGLSRAMDLILTGRAVDSKEALSIGLANRVVPDGTVLEAAEKLALEIASFPQECMLADRKSAYDQHNYSIAEAIKREFIGSKKIAEEKIVEGVTRFNKKEY